MTLVYTEAMMSDLGDEDDAKKTEYQPRGGIEQSAFDHLEREFQDVCATILKYWMLSFCDKYKPEDNNIYETFKFLQL